MNNKPNIKLSVSDEPYISTQNMSNDIYDIYIVTEGFRYALREWRKWTNDTIIDIYDNCEHEYTRAEYSTILINDIICIIESNGYKLIDSNDVIVRKFMHYWLQLYNSKGINYRLPRHNSNPDQEDYEEWNNIFNYEFWEHFLVNYKIYGAFDDSIIGRELSMNIGDFLWIYIDINNSPIIIDRRIQISNIEEDMMHSYDEYDDDMKKKLLASKSNPDEVNNQKHNNYY
jgi:hypothetical protein